MSPLSEQMSVYLLTPKEFNINLDLKKTIVKTTHVIKADPAQIWQIISGTDDVDTGFPLINSCRIIGSGEGAKRICGTTAGELYIDYPNHPTTVPSPNRMKMRPNFVKEPCSKQTRDLVWFSLRLEPSAFAPL